MFGVPLTAVLSTLMTSAGLYRTAAGALPLPRGVTEKVFTICRNPHLPQSCVQMRQDKPPARQMKSGHALPSGSQIVHEPLAW